MGMIRRTKWLISGLILCFAGILSAAAAAPNPKPPAAPARPESTPPPAPARPEPSPIAALLLDRAEREVVRVRELVASGTLPASRLTEAESELEDAKDEVILSATLYGQSHLQDMTTEDANSMLGAARRRVDRERRIVADQQKLLESGVIAQSEMSTCEDELESREQVLTLATNRSQLLKQLQQMAETEQRIEHSSDSRYVMIRYNGNGAFHMSDLPVISRDFEKRFHKPLPISALGQTALHQAMGLDHHNRVDVALNPDQPEGLWLRHLLEDLHVPYLAFRSAVIGAATAPHIHIGTGSTRLKLAGR